MTNISLNKAEVDQLMKDVGILQRVSRGEITQRVAATQLGLNSTRQVRNKLKVLSDEGHTGLIHKNKGAPRQT